MTKFPQRKIGNDFVSAIGLGCMGMSIELPSRPLTDDESLKVLTAAADMGVTFWDTSDLYGPFTNERLLGRWFEETGRRDEIFLGTKFGVKFADGKISVDGSPEYVKQACAGSLERLGTDRIDLYYQHRIDKNTPIEKTIEAMAELKAEGKIRYLGLSECSARSLKRASKVHPIATAQMEFSPFALELESEQTDFLRTARELGVKIVADDLDPKDVRAMMHPRFSEENFTNNLKLVEGFEELAKLKGCTTGQLAIVWVMAQGEDFIPIPGTKRLKYLNENAGAANVKFTKEDEREVRGMLDRIGGAKGARYPAALLNDCFGDCVELGST